MMTIRLTAVIFTQERIIGIHQNLGVETAAEFMNAVFIFLPELESEQESPICYDSKAIQNEHFENKSLYKL